MTDARILEVRTTREVAKVNVPDVDINPEDSLGWALWLTREVNVRRLGNPDDYRVHVWHRTKGWIEHRRG